MDIIKVSTKSRTSAVAGAIAGVFRTYHQAIIQAIGAGAVNQMVKAIALARSYLESDGLEVVFTPEFIEVEIDGKTRTAIRFLAFLRYPDADLLTPTERAADSYSKEPTEETPIDPIEETPIDPIEETPIDPIEETPIDPIEETPIDPIEETPIDPTEETPIDLTEETPIDPIEEAPIDPTEEAPIDPTETEM